MKNIKKYKKTKMSLFFIILIIVLSVIVGCNPPISTPVVISTIPTDTDTDVPINGQITAIFSEEMDSTTIISTNFTVYNGTTPVSGTVTYNIPNKTAVFAPTEALTVETEYTATIKSTVTSSLGETMAADEVWTFTTSVAGTGPEPVMLGTAANYAILAKTAISTVPDSSITGDIGLSPAAETFMTGFSQTKATGYSTSTQITGYMYAADMTPPTPSNLTTAISDMELAYTDAAGRTTPDELNLKTGTLNGDTLAPGLYKWTSSVMITGDITISGNSNDVWIFQVEGDLSLDSAFSVILSGGALPQNVFWQVSGNVVMGTNSHFKGIVLCKTDVTLNTSASMNGRILAQTNVALDQATVTKPTY